MHLTGTRPKVHSPNKLQRKRTDKSERAGLGEVIGMIYPTRGNEWLRMRPRESGVRRVGVASFPLRVRAGKLIAAGILAATLATGPFSSAARAENIETLLPYVVDNHDRVRADEARLRAARNRAREALGDWYPTLSNTLNAGTERQQNDNGDDTSTGFNEWDISLTQLLWDFGSTNASIDKARLQVEEARLNLIETRQSLILEAITAYMNLIRAHQTVQFADQSAENIRKQTGLEEALVGLGSGFSTDVLQAKSQLAGAEARRASSEGALSAALNRYKAVFGRVPDDIDALETVPFPAPFLPTSLTQATDIALEMNPSLKNAILASDIAREDVRKARADNFTPKIEASGSRKFKNNVGGTIGSEQETLAKVEMTFDFNLGFTAVNTLKASEQDLSASTYSAADTRRTIEEQVRNAWQQLDTAKRTASHLDNQANIEAAFLDLARNERQLGRRSLIDVLSGETTLINAKSDALSARTDVVIAAYGLLAASGLLEYDIIKQSKGIEPPVHSPPSPVREAPPAAAPVPPVSPSPAPQDRTRLYDPDTAVARARSSKDLLEMMAQASAPKPPAPTSTLLASISTPKPVAASAELGFDITALGKDYETYATDVVVSAEFASMEATIAPASDMPVISDIADTAGPGTVALVEMLESTPIEALTLPPLEVAATEVDTALIDMLAPQAVRLDQGIPVSSSVPREIEIAEASVAAPLPEPAPTADVDPGHAETVAAFETSAGGENEKVDIVDGVLGVFRFLEAAHAEYEASSSGAADMPVEVAVAAEPARGSRPEPISDNDVPDTTADAVEETFGGLFDILNEAYQRKLESDAGVAPASETPAVAALDPDPVVPESFADAVSATMTDVLPADNATASVETASVSGTAPEMEPTPEVPENLGTSIEATFGGLFDFLEEAHRRKLEADAAKPSAAPVRPQSERKPAAPVKSAKKADAPVAPGGSPLDVVASSLGSLFGDIANLDLTYRPLRPDERTRQD